MKKIIILFSAIALFATACNNTAEEESTTATEETATDTAPADEEVAAEITIDINGGDDMKYDLAEIKVKEGQKVTINLHHTGKMDKTAMGHNFVILNQGVDLTAFATEAINAKDSDYIPADSKEVLAHTDLIGGGESTSVTFDAPAKGTYDFLCTFPGHYGTMQGKFIVE